MYDPCIGVINEDWGLRYVRMCSERRYCKRGKFSVGKIFNKYSDLKEMIDTSRYS